MARRRRSYRGLEVVPGLSGIASSLKGSVRGMDVLWGIGVFLAAHFGVKYAMNKWLVGKVPDIAMRFTPVISGAIAAVALGYAGKRFFKLSPPKVSGLTAGALAAGVAIVAMQEAKAAFPQLADFADLRLSGMILEDPTLRGMLLTDAATAIPYGESYIQTDFAALAAAGDGEDEDGGY